MYLVDSELLKSPKLTIDHLEVGKIEEKLSFGCHQMMPQQSINNVFASLNDPTNKC
jgi:hypothetical protein